MVAPPAAGRNAGSDAPGGLQGPIDVDTIAGWLRVFAAEGEVVELRAFRKGKGVRAGYFDPAHLHDMARCAAQLSDSGDYKGVYFVLNPLAPGLLSRAPYAVGPVSRTAADADVTRRRWLLVDVDPQRAAGTSATDAEKAAAQEKALRVRAYLGGQGWPAPVLADSGNGFHLLYRIDLATDDGGLVRRVLHALAARFDGGGVNIDRLVFNPSRLTKLYGTVSRKGTATPERPHRASRVLEVPAGPGVVSAELLGRLAGPAPAAATTREVAVSGADAPAPVAPAVPPADKLKRAERYVAEMPEAVQGKGGDKQTFAVACVLVLDFDLSVEEALPLFLKYNERCQPPWDEKDLRRKLEIADRKAGERGRLLRGQPDPQAAPAQTDSPDGCPFLGAVPDFLQWDAALARPRPAAPRVDRRGRAKKGPLLSRDWVLDVVRHAVVTQRCSLVLLPDVYLAQLVWGATHWPPNWRRTIAGALLRGAPDVVAVDPFVETTADGEQLRPAGAGWRRGEANCPVDCPLHGRQGVRHRHFRLVLSESAWGVMRGFVAERHGPDYAEFDFRNRRLTRDEVAARKRELKRRLQECTDYLEAPRRNTPAEWLWETVEDIDRMRREQRTLRPGCHAVPGVRAVYLPPRLFGPSPRSGLTAPQCKLLAALPLEVTRHARHNPRPDKAQVLRVGAAPDPGLPSVPVHPGLPDGDYVLFNGTGTAGRRRLHGYGFRLATWMAKAGYGAAAGYPVLGDLLALRAPFGLCVAAWNTRTREWKTLDELAALRGTAPGRRWLDRCVLRIYAPAGYLARWRQYFAGRLGFSSIPGGQEAPTAAAAAAAPAPVTVRTAEELQAWMRREGLTDAALAAALGLHRTAVTRYRRGRRRWRAGFQAKLDAYLAGGKASHCSLQVAPM